MVARPGTALSADPDEGIVCTPHPLATEAGLRVLRSGGTAAEAAVAAGAVLAVVCPHFCGLGGDAMWMLADGQGLRTSVLGIGQAAAACTPARGRPIPVRGPGAMLTTAGLVPSWEALLQLSATLWEGRAPLGELLGAAQDLAATGFAVSASHAFWLDYRKDELPEWPRFAGAFLPRGQIPHPGQVFRQPGLARILSLLADEGLCSFRTGRVAREIAAGLAEAGSILTADDLARTGARSETPLALRSGGWTLFAPPPPTQGATTLIIRGILDRIAAPVTDGADPMHRQVEAVKQAFLRRQGIADPAFTDQSRVLPDAAGLRAMAEAVSVKEALPWPHQFAEADTVFLAVVDGRGRSVCGLQSTYFDWGSGVPVGDTGILWHNRGAGFDTCEGAANRLAPGKRPFHTLNPGMAFHDDGSVILYGTQGADGQPQTLTVLLDRLLVDGADVAEALAAPRFLLGRTFSDSHDSLKVEESAGEGILATLGARGHEVARLPAFSPLAGQAGVIRIRPDGGKTAAHDPRGEGTAGKC